ncbi:MAG: ABC transporter ATP-binding protein [Deltaproteobacteria bacterium]|nr:ABC transporter ATP-binding protein [Deltaproteobacteria bacterium]
MTTAFAQTETPIVKLVGVDKDYHLGSVIVPALRDVSLSIAAGEFTVIAGPSGSGKTTLLNLIGCVDVATRGDVVIDGADTRQLKEKALTDLRLRSLGFIFQSFNLVGVLDAFDNVEFPLLLQGKLNKVERRDRVMGLLQQVGIEQYAHHRPGELSGGQRQRVAIARALVTQPRIVLADEPTANLDSKTGTAILELMQELNRRGTTFLFSTHDPRVVSRAGRVIRLVDGQIADLNASAEDVAALAAGAH